VLEPAHLGTGFRHPLCRVDHGSGDIGDRLALLVLTAARSGNGGLGTRQQEKDEEEACHSATSTST
jgi:hypothetical protein